MKLKITYDEALTNSYIDLIVANGQRMGRICNVMVTFERELAEGDISNDILALAFDRNFISLEDLKKNRLKEKIAAHQPFIDTFFWSLWRKYKLRIRKSKNLFSDLNIEHYIRGLINLRDYHLVSRNLI